MRSSKKFIVTLLVFTFIAFIFVTYETPYYIYKPGNADSLTKVVNVEEGYPSEGEMHLVTVSGIQATPLLYLIAKFHPHEEIVPLEEAIPEDVTDEDYRIYQLKLMDNSQQSARYVAYEAAHKKASIEFNGVYVMHVVKDMPAEGIIKVGDRIIGVDEQAIKTSKDLIDYLQTIPADSNIAVEILREDKKIVETVKVVAFPEDEDKVGIGIQLINDQEVVVEPPVNFDSGEIGGPSAGLMFSLEMYNQLTEEDISKGYMIAGTGEIDYDGSVMPIGGVDKKVVAAHKKGIEIFLVPNEAGREGSNYQVAKQKAEEIKTDMKIVPIDTFAEALDYLSELESKEKGFVP